MDNRSLTARFSQATDNSMFTQTFSL